jgi:hypothetical protein
VCGKFRKISAPAAPLANYSLKFTENSGYWDTPTVGVHVCRAGGELLILFRVIKVARRARSKFVAWMFCRLGRVMS